VYLFGGFGSTIYQVTSTGTTFVGSLPSATADAAIATVGTTAYVIGGFNGISDLDTIVAFTPNSTPQVVATLPVGLRFATATSVNGQVYVIGGETNGVSSATVYRFDPVGNTVAAFTQLPFAREREAAASLDGRILVIGGVSTSSGTRTRAIYAINVGSGKVHLAGLLPLALSDMTAVEGANEVLAAGGVPSAGTASAAIYAITASSV
jgi:N-acetylneuraminic acid mutarotase